MQDITANLDTSRRFDGKWNVWRQFTKHDTRQVIVAVFTEYEEAVAYICSKQRNKRKNRNG